MRLREKSFHNLNEAVIPIGRRKRSWSLYVQRCFMMSVMDRFPILSKKFSIRITRIGPAVLLLGEYRNQSSPSRITIHLPGTDSSGYSQDLSISRSWSVLFPVRWMLTVWIICCGMLTLRV